MARNPSIGNPAPYAVQAVVQGLSATEALDEIRAAGGGVSTQNWYRAFGEAQQAIASVRDVSGVDMLNTPAADQWTEWAAGEGGQYAYQFTFSGRDRETGLPVSMPWTVMSDTPITPAEAMLQAIQAQGDTAADDEYPVDIGYPVSLNLYQTIPYE